MTGPLKFLALILLMLGMLVTVYLSNWNPFAIAATLVVWLICIRSAWKLGRRD